MCILLVFTVTILLQACALGNANQVFKRSPQNIQSIRQKQVSPDITVVDVVVNEPSRVRNPNHNQYIQPVYQQPQFQRPTNYYPNGQYQNNPNVRQPDIQVIEIVDPSAISNSQPWRGYPPGHRGVMNQYPNFYPGGFEPNQRPRYPPNWNTPPRRNRPNGRPFRPTADFYIIEDTNDDRVFPGRDQEPPGHHHHHHHNRPKPPKNSNESQDSEEEEEKYIFDGGDQKVDGYTKDNFPIINLHKNDIRR